MNQILKEEENLATGMQTESVEKLLSDLAQQTKSIDSKLKIIVDKHVIQDLQNHYNEVNNTLSILKEKMA